MRSLKDSPKTNIIGGILTITALLIFGAQYFIELKEEVHNGILLLIGGIGLIIWLGASDEAVKILINKILGNKDESHSKK